VVTSKYSYNFPPDKLIGRVAEINSDPATGFYLLKIRASVNFATIQLVHIVENLQREEQLQLEKDTEKKVEQQKKGK
jgi:rod shape-determining protein MreC